MAIRHCFDKDVDQVLFEGNSSVKRVILNRPHKLNSLSYHMIFQMIKELKAFEADPKVKIVILKGNGKAFCAGGDVLASYTCLVAGHWSYGTNFYKKQVMLDYLVATYGKPVVAIIDGIVMGGGAGLSLQATFRIVTENTVFAMPETAIGHFADVGSSYFLSRLPGFYGEYLGLTGAKIRGAEMVECGLATHFMLAKDVCLLETALDEVTSDTKTISEIISKFTHKSNDKQHGAYSRLEIINKCFSRTTVEEILSSLESEAETKSEKWILDAINWIKSACPTSLKISLRSIREGRTKELEQCLIQECTIVCHIVRRTVSNDFYEGVRAILLDKDKNPKWEPSKLELVTDEMVDKYFSRVDEDEMEPLQLPARSNLVDTMRPKL
ncbi:3-HYDROXYISOBUTYRYL-COA HYDROLASE-RELATED [Salix purpurea]|uniref:3-hydroxyisobutyryl-CoA hydrolase n=1 Tax=Salix purpurea TaxID=77065 RepID=A0A9Q0ZF52_SALPP|nr:3-HYDROXYISOBUTYRYL-COA HYDROLASE-RELATED [Salix purpurea]